MTDVPPPTDLVGQLRQANELFVEIASGQGAAVLLLACGTLLIAGSVAFLGYLSLGAAVDAVTPN
ncbi:hypothetical protein [Halovivax limisalsi]|uniref:hypothetical protein n=1 Tax=Halovivax limisalsi TaxID=1453760 RepID=UPI001FFCBD26|nr:hypothetical protein [Halovivax limisalsi]